MTCEVKSPGLDRASTGPAHDLAGHRGADPGRLHRWLCSLGRIAMSHLVPAVLLLVAAIHALPLVGVLSAAQVSRLYGLAVLDPNLEILLRHRAVLFGLLAAFLAYAAFNRPLHTLALVAGAVSVLSFLAVAWAVGGYNAALSTVVKADILAAALLAVAAIAHGLGSNAD
jgi:hypothetical protein